MCAMAPDNLQCSNCGATETVRRSKAAPIIWLTVGWVLTLLLLLGLAARYVMLLSDSRIGEYRLAENLTAITPAHIMLVVLILALVIGHRRFARCLDLACPKCGHRWRSHIPVQMKRKWCPVDGEQYDSGAVWCSKHEVALVSSPSADSNENRQNTTTTT